MQHFITVCLLALTLVGCNRAPQTAKDAALQVWRSADSSLEQRADAARKLVPKGAGADEIRRVLGEPCIWVHYHGPSVDLVSGATNLTPFDVWRLEYRFGDGGVAMTFDPPTQLGGFTNAVPFHIFTSSPLTNQP